MFGWLKKLLDKIFGGDDEDDNPPVTPPNPTPIPVDPHEPPAPKPPSPQPGPEPPGPAPVPPDDVTPVPAPEPPGDGMAVDMTIKGEPVLLKLNQHGQPDATKVVVSGKPGQKVKVECVVDMEYVGSPALLAQLVETQAFRDNAPLPGAAQIILTSWPYTNPRLYIEDVKPVGTDVATGKPGGYAHILENQATHKSIYLANITEHAVRFKFTLSLVIRTTGETYGLVRGQIMSHYGDDRRRYFELWINKANGDI